MNENLRALLQNSYSEALTEQIMAGYAAERLVTLRINTLKLSPQAGKEGLREAGIAFRRVPWYEDALILENATEEDVKRTSLYERGEIYLQSLSSMLPPLVLEPKAGESILDMTAAPGGKTTELCALSGGKALITACERDKFRYERLLFNLNRQGAARVTPMCVDAGTLDDFFAFDKILLDAPCSGSGTVSLKKPARIDAAYVERCATAQERLLKKAIKLLKKGGTLVYSTCSVFPRENDEVISRALKGSGAELVPVEPFQGLPLLPSKEGTVCVCPSELYEGFYLAKIIKQ